MRLGHFSVSLAVKDIAASRAFYEKLGLVFGENPPPHLTSQDSIEYAALAPELLADQVVYAVNQPWGVSISDLTVRASNDDYVI